LATLVQRTYTRSEVCHGTVFVCLSVRQLQAGFLSKLSNGSSWFSVQRSCQKGFRIPPNTGLPCGTLSITINLYLISRGEGLSHSCSPKCCQLVILKLIHTATPDTTKLSCLCRVRFGGVNWIPDNSRLSTTENLKSEHVQSNRPIHTATRQHCRACLSTAAAGTQARQAARPPTRSDVVR